MLNCLGVGWLPGWFSFTMTLLDRLRPALKLIIEIWGELLAVGPMYMDPAWAGDTTVMTPTTAVASQLTPASGTLNVRGCPATSRLDTPSPVFVLTTRVVSQG